MFRLLIPLLIAEFSILGYVTARLCDGTTSQMVSSALSHLSGNDICASWHEREAHGKNPLHYASDMFRAYERILSIRNRDRWHDVGYDADAIMVRVVAEVAVAEPRLDSGDIQERTRLVYDEMRNLSAAFSSVPFNVGMTWLDKSTFEFLDLSTMKAHETRAIYIQKSSWSRYFLKTFPELMPAERNPGKLLARKFVLLANEQEISRLIHECLNKLNGLHKELRSFGRHILQLQSAFQEDITATKLKCAPWEGLRDSKRLSWYDWFRLKCILGAVPSSCTVPLEVAATHITSVLREVERMSDKVIESRKAWEGMGQMFDWMETQLVAKAWIAPEVDVFDSEVTAFLNNFANTKLKHEEKKWERYR